MTTRQEAERYLERFIPKSTSQKFPAEHGLKRAAYLLQLLDNPQEKMQTIHVAGTSGKGTTSYIISSLLNSHGKNVGLHLSPHLEDIRERMMVRGRFISDKEFRSFLHVVLKAVEKCAKEFDRPTYFEILTALAFFVFVQKKVDIAVVETGMGGTFDATNTIKRHNKICVITRIGKDHTGILGTTLNEIASQKAGIIQQNNEVVTIYNKFTSDVFKKRTKEKNAQLFLLSNNNWRNVMQDEKGVVFDYHFDKISLPELRLSLFGRHQAENTTLALTAIKSVIKLNEKTTRNTLSNIRFRGRLDKVQKGNTTIIIDGAHNEQKMKALTATLKRMYPKQKYTTILAVKKGKSLVPILRQLKDITNTLITTTYFKDNQDLIHIAHDPAFLAKKARTLGFKKILESSTPEEALKIALKKDKKYILTTGSLYYLQDVYDFLESKK